MNAFQNAELKLSKISQEIGCISDSNCHYIAGLSRRVQETGKSIELLTIRELLELHRLYNKQFNSLYGGE